MVVRDYEGCFCKAVALRAPSFLSVLAIELYALKFGLSFAIDASFLPLIVEIDSRFATQLILKDEVCIAVEGVFVEDIRLLLAYVSSSSIHHVPRTANGVVDSIARYGLSQEDLTFWFDMPPLWLWDCLCDDCPTNSSFV